mmetsp:Transcript_13062/g.20283  ORF Transcript_13062/g.20283 Transcript_13062/m.20283 type:complete len:83 (+) Transcript_13062:139-387(+)
MALQTIFKGVMPPEHISVSFDFQNKVVLFLNRQSQQTIILYGSEAEGLPPQQATGIVQFGNQLIDQFKPKTIIVEEQPLQML